MTFQCTEATDGNSEQNLETFDVVYLAALVGNTKVQKEEIINDISSRMRPGALLIIRSAHSLRSLLYPVPYILLIYITLIFSKILTFLNLGY